jgi:nucleoside-diphosphate-sugar epimerase
VSNILVTGSAGFIGRALVRKLHDIGHHVIEFDVAQGDITSFQDMIPYYKMGIQHVFHLAGKTFVPDSWKDPFGFYQVNVMGTINILELCRKTGARLTYVSSYLYGLPDYLPVDEKHPVKSYNPYSHSKVVADGTCQFYASQFDIPVTIFRPFNAYGPGQSPLFIIPEIIGKVFDPAQPVLEVMDLRPRRDYIYLDDLLEAFLLSLEKSDGIYNLGSGYSRSVSEIVELVFQYSGITKEVRARGNNRPNEIFDLYADFSKLKNQFHWVPKTSFESGIKKCVDHYLQQGS